MSKSTTNVMTCRHCLGVIGPLEAAAYEPTTGYYSHLNCAGSRHGTTTLYSGSPPVTVVSGSAHDQEIEKLSARVAALESALGELVKMVEDYHTDTRTSGQDLVMAAARARLTLKYPHYQK